MKYQCEQKFWGWFWGIVVTTAAGVFFYFFISMLIEQQTQANECGENCQDYKSKIISQQCFCSLDGEWRLPNKVKELTK